MTDHCAHTSALGAGDRARGLRRLLRFGRRNLRSGHRRNTPAGPRAEVRLAALEQAHKVARAPLMAMISAAESVRALSPADRQAELAAASITRAGRHTLASLDELLELARIEAGRCEARLIDCSPALVLAEVASLAAPGGDSTGDGFTIVYASAVPARIRTDPQRLRSALLALARLAAPEAGQANVRLEVTFCDEPEPSLRFRIRRRGAAGEDDPGRALVAQLAILLGGLLEWSGGAEGDATVTIPTGPVDGVAMVGAASQGPAPAVCETEAGSAAEARILLVEQEGDRQRRIAAMLREAGAEVEVEDNGADGCERALVAAAAGRPFDTVLMDLQLPALDGYEATRRLRREGYAGAIVAIGGRQTAQERSACLEAGCDDVVFAPLAACDLVRACALRRAHQVGATAA